MSRNDKNQNRQEDSPVPADDREPITENRPVPVLLIALLIALLFWGDMYVMRHGADVGGASGAFPGNVYYPFVRHDQIPQTGAGPLLGSKMYAQNCSICHQPTGM